MTPAEELRAAAKVLRETASRTLGINRPWRYSPGKPSDSVRTESGWEIAYGDDPSNLRWIALASPTLAEPLAAWLETTADWWDAFGIDPETDHPALATARTILGRQP